MVMRRPWWLLLLGVGAGGSCLPTRMQLRKPCLRSPPVSPLRLPRHIQAKPSPATPSTPSLAHSGPFSAVKDTTNTAQQQHQRTPEAANPLQTGRNPSRDARRPRKTQLTTTGATLMLSPQRNSKAFADTRCRIWPNRRHRLSVTAVTRHIRDSAVVFF
ncbi:hypothetical protein EDB80DRAFT_120232 [Ilyonectria destructans]|nr:hypothetical protein EDB80DRAFT_120232 [Ilyonectria destructans]